LAVNVAPKVHQTGVDNWIKQMEAQKELPFIKFCEGGFEPNIKSVKDSETPIVDMVETRIVSPKSLWELTDSQIAFM